MKALTKILVVVMFLALIAAGIGFALEGFELDSVLQAAKVISDDDFELKEEVVETAVQKIVIDAENDNIILTNSTDGNIYVSYYISEEYKETSFTTDNGIVKLEAKYKPFKMWFKFSVNISSSDKISVAVPADFDGQIDFQTRNGSIKSEVANTFLSVDLKTTNSKITLKNLTVTNDAQLKTTNDDIIISKAEFKSNLTLNSTNGDIEIGNITVDGNLFAKSTNEEIEITTTTVLGTMSLETSNDDIVLDKTTVSGNTKLKSTNGKIAAENSILHDAEFKTTNGQIYTRNLTVRNLDAKTTNTKIDISVNGSYSEYEVYVKTSNSERYVNGMKVSNGTHNSGGEKLIKAETSNSDITIRFQ